MLKGKIISKLHPPFPSPFHPLTPNQTMPHGRHSTHTPQKEAFLLTLLEKSLCQIFGHFTKNDYLMKYFCEKICLYECLFLLNVDCLNFLNDIQNTFTPAGSSEQ